MTAKATKAVDYSTYSFKRLFKELDSTSEQIANLQGKKAQIEQALRQKPEIPTDETAYDLKNAYTIGTFDSYEEFEKALERGEI